MKISTKRLVLRDLTRKDLDSLVKNINNLNVSEYLPVIPYPYTKKDGLDFICCCIKNAKSKLRTEFHFGIELKKEGNLIGMIGLVKVDRYCGVGTIGYWLGQPYWRNGYATEAVKRIIRYAFVTPKLRRINVEDFVENEGSDKIIRRSGFTYEGTKRQSERSRSTGRIHDVNVYVLLREDWLKNKQMIS